jgi:hypothetical protein
MFNNVLAQTGALARASYVGIGMHMLTSQLRPGRQPRQMKSGPSYLA